MNINTAETKWQMCGFMLVDYSVVIHSVLTTKLQNLTSRIFNEMKP
jgi:hypothetical protein